MDYNTQRKSLPLPEYGRTIQQMVDYCLTIEDRAERTKAANTVISIMGNMNPHLRDVSDFKHKLWDHLAIMSDFQLNIDWPYPLPDLELMSLKPAKLPYSENKFKYVHYGKFTEQILSKIHSMEDPEERKTLIEIMANHMKRSYMVWKREQISDEIIFRELLLLTKGEFEIPSDLKLGDFRDALVPQAPVNTSKTVRRKTQKRRK